MTKSQQPRIRGDGYIMMERREAFGFFWRLWAVGGVRGGNVHRN